MAKTHDIEDVLSSIRRLVAEETEPSSPAPVAGTRSRGPVLVLEEAHRVTDPEDPFQMIRVLTPEDRIVPDTEPLILIQADAVPSAATEQSDGDGAKHADAGPGRDDESTDPAGRGLIDTAGGVLPRDGLAPKPGDELTRLSTALTGDEALRDLIAEIVRQELAGDLGERITRNVRKLVRREIRQMLASADLD